MTADTFINNNNMKLCVNIYIQSMHLPNLYIQECQIEINFTQTWGNVQKKEFTRIVDDGKTLQISNRPN